ncbi:rhamnan synthesis F family protein [Brevibacterium samyangense]|uniref:Rhamnan synthesis protein F n=1 Tax=Brevibacterium samyangense TaxID=366888 RepID=A0ABP5F5Q5_9MICO
MFTSVRRLAVVAHFDTSRSLAPHVRHMLDEIVSVTDRVALVSTSGVDDDGLAWLRSRPSVLYAERENVGYDFKSLQVGYQALGDPGNAEILFCNDSFIGPFLPLDSLFRTMDSRRVDFWGMTRSVEIVPHVQSYFMVFKPHVVRSSTFRNFWMDFGTPKDRAEAINNGELKLTRVLEDAGFTSGAYFEPTDEDALLANQRFAYLMVPESLPPGSVDGWWDATWRSRTASANAMQFNSTIALADAAFSERLPLLKIEALRLDPWELGGRALGAHLANRYPRMFEGVPEFLSRTDHIYAGRYTKKNLRSKFPQLYNAVRYQY